MNRDKIKPIPKYIVKLIEKRDKIDYPAQDGHNRYYAYLTKNEGELCKVTVCVRNYRKKLYIKQCAIHGIQSEKCFVKDMCYTMIAGYTTGWYYEGLTRYPKWYEDKEWGWCDDKYFNPYAPIVNKEYLGNIYEFKYSAFSLYSEDLFEYLKYYLVYPECEYIVKLGLSKLATSKSILDMCRKSKEFRKWLAKNRDVIKGKYFYTSVIVNAFKKNLDLEDLQEFESRKRYFVKDDCYKTLKGLFKSNLLEFFNYIDKQDISYNLYTDYIKACKELELDLTEDKNLFPHDFKKWHDIRIDEYHTLLAERDKEKRKELYDKFYSISTKYSALQRDMKDLYVCIIPTSPQDLINEGEALHHCVGRMNYDQKFAREETLIFFIRNKETPNIPLVTIEYSLSRKKVLQCYGDRDSKPCEDIEKYVYKTWLPYANRKLRKIA